MKAARTAARTAALAALALGCGSCSEEYLARRDTLAPGSGDAVRANAAIQAIDPWPRHARRVDTDMSGERLQHAMESYRNPSSGASFGGQQGQQSQAAPIGGGATPTPR